MTIAVVRIVAWPSPQSSVQMTGNVPVFVGVMCSCVCRPGHRVLLLPELRHPERVDDVERLERELDGAAERAAAASPLVRFCASGYEKLHANCCATTFTRKTFLPWASFRPSTIALTMPIAVTRIVGMSVQTISRPVWPWIGGPSESSSGAARKLRIE